MRPSTLRNYCKNAGSIWHYHVDGKSGEIEKEDFPKNLSGVQCGEQPQFHVYDLTRY